MSSESTADEKNSTIVSDNNNTDQLNLKNLYDRIKALSAFLDFDFRTSQLNTSLPVICVGTLKSMRLKIKVTVSARSECDAFLLVMQKLEPIISKFEQDTMQQASTQFVSMMNNLRESASMFEDVD
jgi:hypothetical protein